MSTTKTVAFAGFDEAQLHVLNSACDGLTSATLRLSAEVWSGTREDLIIINPENPQMLESAIRLTSRRGGHYVVLPALDDSASHSAAILAVQRAVASALREGQAGAVPMVASNDLATRPSLFDSLKDLIADGVDDSASCSSCHVLILPDAGKVRARSELAFGMFRTFFGRSDWEIRPLLAPFDLDEFNVSHSLESFLMDACLRIRFRLPTVRPGPFRLTTYPDLGELTGQSDALSLASSAMRPQASVQALADLAGVDLPRANAFVLAASMLGLVDRQPAEA